ncbi:very-long-chain 3-oxoacyl-CoA reductase-like [Daktulosphaira vitifoliae]|uniref:very-long-chain 3-oxoacyl-CoA reductase-like n=1 Tax=Daktulosphaira vitifoliae TaxID=58002 RepID=UPI0021A9BD21|nr:very-long-chain 3-oxoacyl-CoA reductase-like [Daktulosphaira vitifoliae]
MTFISSFKEIYEFSREYVEYIGIFTICVTILKLGYGIIKSIISYIISSLVNFKKSGNWAVITGATDGIGKSYAEQLAEKGMDVILISRNKSKLETQANEIKSKYNVNTKIIEMDFTESNIEIYKTCLEKELKDMSIGVLVNNVGMSYSPNYFLKHYKNNPLYQNLIQCNIMSVIHLCGIVLPGMKKRNHGIIINISALSADLPSPLLSVYGASKAFIKKFSEELATEYGPDGITVQCFMPGFVTTKLSDLTEASWFVPSPDDYVRSALKMIGAATVTTGYFAHTVWQSLIHIGNAVIPQYTNKMLMKSVTKNKLSMLKDTVETVNTII